MTARSYSCTTWARAPITNHDEFDDNDEDGDDLGTWACAPIMIHDT